MTILLPSLAVLIPILTLPFWFFSFDIVPKVAVLLCGAAAICVMAPWRMQSLRVVPRHVVVLLALQALALVVATIASTNVPLSVSGGNWRSYGLVTQLALLIVTLSAVAGLRLEATLRAIAVSGSVIALYSIVQYFGWDPLLPSAAYHIGEGEWTIVRPPGTVGHADYLGTYLVFVVFLGGSLAQRESSARWRAVGMASAVLGSLAIALSGTRSAMLGLAFGAVLVAFCFRPPWKRIAVIVALGAVLLAAFYYSAYGLKMRGRTRWFREDPAGGARLLLWRDSARMVLRRWAMGWGPETFSTEFPRFQSLELARAYPDFYHESPHNIFVDEIVVKGVLGAVPFLGWSLAGGRTPAWRRPTAARRDASGDRTAGGIDQPAVQRLRSHYGFLLLSDVGRTAGATGRSRRRRATEMARRRGIVSTRFVSPHIRRPLVYRRCIARPGTYAVGSGPCS